MKKSHLWKVKFAPKPGTRGLPGCQSSQLVVSDTVEDALALVRTEHPAAEFQRIGRRGEVWVEEVGLMGIGTPEEELAFARESVGLPEALDDASIGSAGEERSDGAEEGGSGG